MPGGNAWRKNDSGKFDSGKKLTQAKSDSGKKCPEEMPGGNAWRKNDSGK